jgi:hypothetical protein
MTAWQVNAVAIPALAPRGPLPQCGSDRPGSDDLSLGDRTSGDRTSDDLTTSPWLALCPPAVVQLRDPEPARVRALAPGVAVALVSDRRFARRRLRDLADEAGLRVDHELIVFPSTANPLVALHDSQAAVRYFWSALPAVSAGAASTGFPRTLPRRLVKALPWRWTGALGGGRVVVGVRR